MGVAAPWFLAGLVAIGIPLYVHLLRQFDRTPQPFPSLRFFERRVQSATKHRRLRYLSLLALRLLLFALLTLAFADPFTNHPVTVARARTLTVIAIDRSFSMHAGDRMQQARTLAHALIDHLPGGTRAQVLAVDSHTQALTQASGDRGILGAAVDTLQAGDEASSYGEFARSLRVLDANGGLRLDVRFLTDAQQTAMPTSFADLQLGPRTTLRVTPVGRSQVGNWAVQSVEAPPQVHDAKGVRIVASVAGWNARTMTRHVALLLDGRTVAQKEVMVPDCGRQQVEFNDVAVPYGAHRGEVRISPSDDLPQDDSFAFSIERTEPRPVLFLYAHGRSHEQLFYQAALSSASSALEMSAQPLEDAAVADLSKYAFLVLNDPGALDDEANRRVTAYVRAGGSALIAIGTSTVGTRTAPILNTPIRYSTLTQSAAPVDRSFPDFGSVQFLSTPIVTPGPSAQILARFSDGSPLLVQQSLGQGRVLLFASTLDNHSSDFPVHPSFVAFVEQTAHILSGADDTQSSYIVGSTIALRRGTVQSTAADVIGPGGSHELSLAESTRQNDYRLGRAGFFDVKRADGRRFLVAANSDRRESDLTPIPSETLALWSSTAPPDPSRGGIEQTEVERFPLWPYFLIMAILVGLAESIYSSRYLKQEKLIR